MIKIIREIADDIETQNNLVDIKIKISNLLKNVSLDKNKFISLSTENYVLPAYWINFLVENKEYKMAFDLLNNYEFIFGEDMRRSYDGKNSLVRKIAYKNSFKDHEFFKFILMNNPDILAENKNNHNKFEAIRYGVKHYDLRGNKGCGDIYKSLFNYFESNSEIKEITEEKISDYKYSFNIIHKLSIENNWPSIHPDLWHYRNYVTKKEGIPLLTLILQNCSYDGFGEYFRMSVEDDPEDISRLNKTIELIGGNINKLKTRSLAVFMNNMIEKLSFKDYLNTESIIKKYLINPINLLKELTEEHYEEQNLNDKNLKNNSLHILNKSTVEKCDVNSEGYIDPTNVISKLNYLLDLSKENNHYSNENMLSIIFCYINKFDYPMSGAAFNIKMQIEKEMIVRNFENILCGYMDLLKDKDIFESNHELNKKNIVMLLQKNLLIVDSKILTDFIIATKLFEIDVESMFEEINQDRQKISNFMREHMNSNRAIIEKLNKEAERKCIKSKLDESYERRKVKRL